MNDYEAKKQAKADRFRELAQKNQAASQAAGEQAREMLHQIPLGHPRGVGHHAEAGHRRHIARTDSKFKQAWDLSDKAKHYERKADNAENNTAASIESGQVIAEIGVALTAPAEFILITARRMPESLNIIEEEI